MDKFDSVEEAYNHYRSLLDGDATDNLRKWFLLMRYGPWGNVMHPRRRASDNRENHNPWSDIEKVDEWEDPQTHAMKQFVGTMVDRFPLMFSKGNVDSVCWRYLLEGVETNVWFAYGKYGETIWGDQGDSSLDDWVGMVPEGLYRELPVRLSFSGLWDGESHYQAYVDQVGSQVAAAEARCFKSYIRECLGIEPREVEVVTDPSEPDPPDGKGGEEPDSDSDSDVDDSEPLMRHAFYCAEKQEKEREKYLKEETGDPGYEEQDTDDVEEVDKVTEAYVFFTKACRIALV